MGLVNHTVGYSIGAAGVLSGVFALHSAWPDTFDIFAGAGQAYPLQGVGGDILTNVTSTLASIDPLLLGGIAVASLFLANSVMKSDHHSGPEHS